MNKKINVAVTGYFRTGSSAVIDLLREYDCVKVVPYENKSYEHDLFYHHGGFFDLCTLLSHGNNSFSSDKTIGTFVSEMKRLNDYNYVWFGSYKKMFGDRFLNLVYDFVDDISEKRDDRTTNHIKKSRFSFIKLFAQLFYRIFKKRRFTNYGVWYVYDKDDIYYSMPTNDELYAAAKKFTSGYFNLFNSKSDDSAKVSIYDHIIWPSQVDEFANCFDDTFKVIVVDRDPRDLFIMEKYMPTGKKPHFPTNPSNFIDEWKRTAVKDIRNKNAMIVHFEDLVYNYDETIKRIESFLGILSSSHTKPKQFFDNDKSIENTQVFLTFDEWEKETKQIETGLKDYLFNFPYRRKPIRDLMFADDGVGKIKI